ncbi:MAG: sodium-translocating pyrophosphatase [Candidatus Alkanophagales archaeon]
MFEALVVGSAALSLAFAALFAYLVLREERGSERMVEISEAVKEGAMAYLNRQYRTIAVFAAVIFAVLAVAINLRTAVCFLAGAALSALAGYLGMNVSVRANVRVANVAREGVRKALSVAFRGGSVTGLCVVGLALLGISVPFFVLTRGVPPADGAYLEALEAVVGFGFGACLISLFARIGGGIYTKSADVGADLVGKVEKGIPEDDPRNPAVIADNVGDNVGDCAGMAADLFETYAVTAIGAMLLGYLIFKDVDYVLFPLVLGAVAILASIVGVLSVRMREGGSIIGAMYRGLAVAGVLSAIGFYFASKTLVPELGVGIWVASLVGLVVAIALFAITEYYTTDRYRAVRAIAESSQTGPATNIITGLSMGLESTALPALVICGGILASFFAGGSTVTGGIATAGGIAVGAYGVAIAVMGMISLTGMIIAMDSYGPITDNAGGIAEMADLEPEVRETTDALDAVGNTTKAVTKAFAIGSAALAALTLFMAYVVEISIKSGVPISEILERFNLADPYVLAGLLIGGLIPFLFSAFCLRAVGKGAFKVVEEVRRQFREIEGIMEGRSRPEYGRCVDIVTREALKGMTVPGLIAVLFPLAVGFALGPVALGGLLLGSIVTGLLLALQMATGGAAWDNAKKYIEKGNLGGKGSDAHKAAVVGDTVGDPCKDTAGPAINPLIKVMNTVAILFAGLITSHAILGGLV